jgi:hypothetical protein
LQCGAFIRAAKRSAGIRDSGQALDQSLGLLDLEELKQAASNGEAGLVRRTAACGNPTPLGMLHAAELGAGTLAVRYGGIRQFPRVTTSMPTRAFFHQTRWIMIIFDLLEAFFIDS